MTKNLILFGLLALIAFTGKGQTNGVPFNEKLPHDCGKSGSIGD